MPSRYSKSSGKSQRSSFHDTFPRIFENNVPHSNSIISGVFRGCWPPTHGNENTDRYHQTLQNDQVEAIKMIMKPSDKEPAVSTKDLEDLLRYEMARVVYGSNFVERVGLGFEETISLSLKIFRGEKIGNMSDMDSSHLEVTNHATAFLHLLDHFVIKQHPLTEPLIKETHAILCNNLSASDAGVLSSKTWGGVYRSISSNEKAFAGAHQFTKPSEIPKAMKSLISNLQTDIETNQTMQNSTSKFESGVSGKFEGNQHINIYQLAAKYCERFVQIHPFRDGNGRMCRLILNVLLIRFAGVAVAIGMNEGERDEYLFCAQESGRVGGDSEGLGAIVERNSVETLVRWRSGLGKLRRFLVVKGGGVEVE